MANRQVKEQAECKTLIMVCHIMN